MSDLQYVVFRSKEDYLAHHGVKGQKWDIRNYQNADGSLTAEGKARYGQQYGYENRSMYKRGTITREQYLARKKELKNNGAGTYDYMTSGQTRRLREFQRRHEKGYTVATTLLMGGLGALPLAAAAVTAAAPLGLAAASAILGGTFGVIGYHAQKSDNFHNRKVLDQTYDSKMS